MLAIAIYMRSFRVSLFAVKLWNVWYPLPLFKVERWLKSTPVYIPVSFDQHETCFMHMCRVEELPPRRRLIHHAQYQPKRSQLPSSLNIKATHPTQHSTHPGTPGKIWPIPGTAETRTNPGPAPLAPMASHHLCLASMQVLTQHRIRTTTQSLQLRWLWTRLVARTCIISRLLRTRALTRTRSRTRSRGRTRGRGGDPTAPWRRLRWRETQRRWGTRRGRWLRYSSRATSMGASSSLVVRMVTDTILLSYSYTVAAQNSGPLEHVCWVWIGYLLGS